MQVRLARQMTEAFLWDSRPRYLLRDRIHSMVRPSADRVQSGCYCAMAKLLHQANEKL